MAAPLPAKLQAVLFKKIFGYDRTLGAKSKVVVLVLDDGGNTEEVVGAFAALGISASAVKPTSLEGQSGSVVYFTKASSIVKSYCSKNKALGISGTPDLANSGDAAISLRARADGRPEIVVNLPLAKSQGQDLSADLLGLATVIQ